MTTAEEQNKLLLGISGAARGAESHQAGAAAAEASEPRAAPGNGAQDLYSRGFFSTYFPIRRNVSKIPVGKVKLWPPLQGKQQQTLIQARPVKFNEKRWAKTGKSPTVLSGFRV